MSIAPLILCAIRLLVSSVRHSPWRYLWKHFAGCCKWNVSSLCFIMVVHVDTRYNWQIGANLCSDLSIVNTSILLFRDRGMVNAVCGLVRWKIGRAHVWTPVTWNDLVCRLLLEKKKKKQKKRKNKKSKEHKVKERWTTRINIHTEKPN